MNQLKLLITISLLKSFAITLTLSTSITTATNSTYLTTSTTSTSTPSTTLSTKAPLNINTTAASTNQTTQIFSTIRITTRSGGTSILVLSVLAIMAFIIVTLAIVFQYNKFKRNLDSYSNISYRNSQVVNTAQQRIENNEIVEFSNPAFHLDEWNLDPKTQKK
jgi:hypothetical protein